MFVDSLDFASQIKKLIGPIYQGAVNTAKNKKTRHLLDGWLPDDFDKHLMSETEAQEQLKQEGVQKVISYFTNKDWFKEKMSCVAATLAFIEYEMASERGALDINQDRIARAALPVLCVLEGLGPAYVREGDWDGVVGVVARPDDEEMAKGNVVVLLGRKEP